MLCLRVVMAVAGRRHERRRASRRPVPSASAGGKSVPAHAVSVAVVVRMFDADLYRGGCIQRFRVGSAVFILLFS